ncbi:hypothetical protein BD410DRAFT_807413 [Rickenella mellea]|uniref:Uncharacterized protein n=1 Tax=Rickenella mellea TaxID=50990 RepID=A0A4Y7PQ08_9AGAM|nr:hypothetical protein BD410DRAFT_807413 [Rickenella mellea]
MPVQVQVLVLTASVVSASLALVLVVMRLLAILPHALVVMLVWMLVPLVNMWPVLTLPVLLVLALLDLMLRHRLLACVCALLELGVAAAHVCDPPPLLRHCYHWWHWGLGWHWGWSWRWRGYRDPCNVDVPSSRSSSSIRGCGDSAGGRSRRVRGSPCVPEIKGKCTRVGVRRCLTAVVNPLERLCLSPRRPLLLVSSSHSVVLVQARFERGAAILDNPFAYPTHPSSSPIHVFVLAEGLVLAGRLRTEMCVGPAVACSLRNVDVERAFKLLLDSAVLHGALVILESGA